MTVVDFLLARIAEDEAVARAASSAGYGFAGVVSEWNFNPASDAAVWADGPQGHWDVAANAMNGRPYARFALRSIEYDLDANHGTHIARWDPKRVLAECAAKRAVIEELNVLDVHIRVEYDDPAPSAERYLTNVLKLLAQPYSEHPGFDEAWRVA